MRLPKPSGKNFIDKTNGTDALGYLLSRMQSSQSPLTQQEIDMQDGDARIGINDLYFARAAQTDYDLIPNKGAVYSGGQLYEDYKKMKLQRQLEMLMKNRSLKR